jgi:undecaprenyl-diphosphatase
MSIYISILYGLIQGLSEFLPVSSSGHLALLPYFMNFKDPGIFFDLMMHIGTGLAVLIYFKADVLRIIKGSIFILVNPTKFKEADPFTLNFIFATICSVIIILAIKDLAFEFGRSSNLIAGNLIFFGIIMYFSDRRSVKKRELSPMLTERKWLHSFIIGASQALAVFPGVSRSGITITSARFLGLSRKEASSFSFLLSLPIIFAAAAKKLIDVNFVVGDNIGMTPLLIGLAVSFVVGIVTIHFFLKLISQTPLAIFSIYRIIIGIIILALPLN